MATQPETAIQRAIQRELKARGCHVSKIHGGPYQEAGISDIIGFMPDGHGIAIEVKDQGAKFSKSEREAIAWLRELGIYCGTAGGCSKLQALYISRCAERGVYTGVATSVDEALEIVGMT